MFTSHVIGVIINEMAYKSDIEVVSKPIKYRYCFGSNLNVELQVGTKTIKISIKKAEGNAINMYFILQ